VADGGRQVTDWPQPLAKPMESGVKAKVDEEILRRQYPRLDAGDAG
jgi:hypothetical protein